MLASSCPVLLQSLGTVALFFFFFQGSSLHLHKNVNGAISEINAQLNPAVPLRKLSAVKAFWHFPSLPLAYTDTRGTASSSLCLSLLWLWHEEGPAPSASCHPAARI